MQNVFISESDRKKYRKGAKDPKGTKPENKKAIGGQSYADEHGIDSVTMALFSCRRHISKMIPIAHEVSETTLESCKDMLELIEDCMNRFNDERKVIAERQLQEKGLKQVSKIFGVDVTPEQLEAMNAILKV